jgi:hypothetical protein
MTRSMTRWALAGCMALAAIGAVAVLDVGSATADAAPSVSPFSGTYVSGGWPVPIAVTDGGDISSSYSGEGRTKGSMSGRIGRDGSYSLTTSRTFIVSGDERGKTSYATSRDTVAGNMALDVDGNIVATGGTGGSFVWFRQ